MRNDNDLICETISLGIPVIFQDNQIAIGDYTLLPEKDADKKITKEHLERWRSQCWIDLSRDNLENWKKIFKEIQEVVDKRKNCVYSDFVNKEIVPSSEDYDIAEILAYYYNSRGKGRKK